MARAPRVVMGKQVTLPDGQVWTLWSDGQKAGRYWACQRAEGSPTRWLEVRPVSQADGTLVWVEAR